MQCGKSLVDRRLSSRIANGKEADPHSIPWQVFMFVVRSGLRYACGGTIVSPFHILSAAHCFLNENGTTLTPGDVITLVIGDHDRQTAGQEIKMEVDCIKVNPSYEPLKGYFKTFFSHILRSTIVGYLLKSQRWLFIQRHCHFGTKDKDSFWWPCPTCLLAFSWWHRLWRQPTDHQWMGPGRNWTISIRFANSQRSCCICQGCSRFLEIDTVCSKRSAQSS